MSDSQEFQNRLKAVLSRIFEGEVDIVSAARLSGGASQETWMIRFCGGDGPGALILRRAPENESYASGAIGLENEARIIRQASLAGVPVPDVIYVLTASDGLGRGFFMSCVEGETLARRILRDEEYAVARHDLPGQCGRALAAIHCMSPASLPELPVRSGLQQIEIYEDGYRSTGACRPVFDLSIRWLKDTAPAPLDPVPLHGDFRLGNIMVSPSGLSAVLDWELAHLGDPREDIAWMCVNSWRFGHTGKRLGGFGDVENLLEAYSTAGGMSLEPKDIDWWEVLGTLKWGVICMQMYETFRSGADPGVERAAIGRRVSETEIDLINLLERQQHA